MHTADSANVYADLGYPDADDMLIKAHLVTKIAELLTVRSEGSHRSKRPGSWDFLNRSSRGYCEANSAGFRSANSSIV